MTFKDLDQPQPKPDDPKEIINQLVDYFALTYARHLLGSQAVEDLKDSLYSSLAPYKDWNP